MDLTHFSQEDLRLLASLIAAERQRIRNSRNRPRVDEVVEYTPEVYVALTPPGGIPPLSYVGTGTIFPGGVFPSLGTGTGTGSSVGFLDSPGSADCSIFRILYTNKQVPELRPVGFKLPVLNLLQAPIPGITFIPIKRDKFGTWLADIDSSALHGGGVFPEVLCWVSNTCPTYSSVASFIGTGSIQAASVINVETTCLNTLTGAVTVTCVQNPKNCCVQCACTCMAGLQPVCLKFSDAPPSSPLSALNGISFTLSVNDTFCANSAGPGNSSILYSGSYSAAGVSMSAELLDPPNSGTSWNNIVLTLYNGAVPGESGLGTDLKTPKAPTLTGIKPSNGGCDPDWNLSYSKVIVYGSATGNPPYRQLGTVNVTVGCGSCSACGGITVTGKGSVATGGLGASSLTLAGVSTTAGDRLIVNIGSGFSGTCTYNGVSMGAADKTVTTPAGQVLQVFSLKITVNTTGGVIFTPSTATVMGMDVVAVSGLTTNAVDTSHSATGTSGTPNSGALTTFTTCEYINFPAVYTPNSTSPTYSGGFSSGGQDVNFGSYKLSEGYQIAATAGSYTGSFSAPTSTDWAAAVVAYK